MQFRKAELNDAENVCALVNSVYRGENSKKGWTTEAYMLDGIRIDKESLKKIISKKDNVIILAINEGEIIGCVHLEQKGNRCHLGMLSVNVNYQDKGIGKKIMEHSEEYAKNEMKCSIMEMKVIGQRKELIDFYIRRGYKITGESEPFLLNTHFGEPKSSDLYFEYLTKEL
jgi:N-acetylglutamate synthase-like GNAT family acetyltransferase